LNNWHKVVKAPIDMEIEEEYEEMFSKMWPNALEKLKRLAETSNNN
jgi:hypothetical protein